MAKGDGAEGAREYLDVIYSVQRKPKTDYPSLLAAHVRETALGGRRGRLLDLGCGRGDQMRAFLADGQEVVGVDYSPRVAELCAPMETYTCDFSKDMVPLPDASIDFVFSKSVVEHLHDPLPLLREAVRVLKPGGRAVIMTPSWRHHGFGPFYLDFTHFTPFTAPSLRDAMLMCGFTNVEVRHFRQLPFLWKAPALLPFVAAFSKLPLPYEPLDIMSWNWPTGFNKFIRFSKEVMLLAIAEKPVNG